MVYIYIKEVKTIYSNTMNSKKRRDSMILNGKKFMTIIPSKEALEFYEYDKDDDVLSLEIVNYEILNLETEYERLNKDDFNVEQDCIINIPRQQYDKISFKIVTKDKDDYNNIIHIQNLTKDDLIISLQEKIVVKDYVTEWYKNNK